MQLEIPYGDSRFPIAVDETRAHVTVARSKNQPPGSWEEVVAEAMARPIGAERIAAQDLTGKKVVVITDDWGRPTPASRVVPLILEELARAGADEREITFVTASGMHDPMSREELERKLGAEVVARYRCISHDGGDWEMLAHVGTSPWGTPAWINRYVVGADYRIGLGRVYLHVTHGYEGGYKLILPGVAGFDSIVRDHSFNFSPDSIPGVHENPSRAEVDNIGRMVGFDFLINVVVNGKSEPVKAFAGAVEPVHQQAIEYGDWEVWGAEVGRLMDVTIASHGAGPIPAAGFDSETLRRACMVTKPGGVVIIPTAAPVPPLPDWQAGERADDAILDRLPLKEFGARLQPLAFSELMRLHERRDWPGPPLRGGAPRREIQWRIKTIRSEFYRRRWLMAANQRQVVFTSDPQAALDAALAAHPEGRPDLLILPEGSTTLPKLCLHRAARI